MTGFRLDPAGRQSYIVLTGKNQRNLSDNPDSGWQPDTGG